MVTNAVRERHTPAMLMWTDAYAFFSAAHELGTDDPPALSSHPTESSSR